MNLKAKIFILLIGAVLLSAPGVARAAGYCFCWVDVNTLKESTNTGILQSTGCANVADINTCKKGSSIFITPDGKQYSDCRSFDAASNPTGALADCNAVKTQWEQLKKARIESVQKSETNAKGITGAVIPTCVTEDFLSPECRDVGVFVLMGINMANYLFSFIGALALIMFIYGGFVLILSQGNQEKVKQGTGIMVAAVIGLIVAFGGYLLIQFLSTSFGVN